MILQGANNPLVVKFDSDVSSLPALVITLWRDAPGQSGTPLKKWELDDMTVDEDTVTCELTESETAQMPTGKIILEAKGLDSEGKTVFWDQYPMTIKSRHDKTIVLSQGV